MADIVEVILADHKRIRRMVGAPDDAASYGGDPCAGWMLAPVWCRLADLPELHAEAEEEICYLALSGQGRPRPRRCRTRSPTMTTTRRGTGSGSARRRFCALGASGRLRPVGQQ